MYHPIDLKRRATLRRRSRRVQTRSGFTLVELIIALTISVIMSGCIWVMLQSISAGTTAQQDIRRFLSRAQSLQAQMATQCHASVNFLAAGSNYVIYWAGDANNNQAVDLNELRAIYYDSTNQQIDLYSGASASTNVTYPANSNWYNVAMAAATANNMVAKPIASNVTAFSATLSDATAMNARMVTMNITINDGVISRTVVCANSVRSFMVPQ
jgi:prepilin-type N-terminal cleavage/methylation domain-containing protein